MDHIKKTFENCKAQGRVSTDREATMLPLRIAGLNLAAFC